MISYGYIQERAKQLGFIGCGFSRPDKPFFYDEFVSWISSNKNAEMKWMQKSIELRKDPSMLLKGCNTIISLAYAYPAEKPCTSDKLCVSRYSQPGEVDYHQRLKKILRELTDTIKTEYRESRSRICVDSAPILERSFAVSAGLGFIGKNNMLIIPGYGSFFYLAEILTTAYLDFPTVTPLENQCGSCRSCIDACPSGALEKPFLLNASSCLSYLTVEKKEPVSPETGILMKDCFFGCDKCQEACPLNPAVNSLDVTLPDTSELLSMNGEDFKEYFGETSLARAGLDKIRSNIIAMI